MAGSNSSKPKGSSHGTSPLEWTAAAFGAVVLALIVGYLVHDGLTGEGAPPSITVERLATITQPGGHLVTIEVRNDGDETAAGLTVRGGLYDGDRLVEESETTIDYVPQGSKRNGGLFF